MGRRKKVDTSIYTTEVTSRGLRQALWGSFQDLKAGKIDPKTANAMATTARGILAVAKLEITVAQLTQSKPSQNLLGFTK